MSDNTTTTQIVQENPQIEAYRLGLLQLSKQLAGQPITLPQQQVAGLSPMQNQAIGMAQSGVGSFQPYLNAGNTALGSSQEAFNNLSPIANDITNLSGQAPGYAQGIGGLAMGNANNGANAAMALGASGTQDYDPMRVQQFMNPYQQFATQSMLDEVNRQAGMDSQKVRAQAINQGSFGGTRAQLTQSEFDRNTMQTRNQMIAQDVSRNYDQAQQASINTWDAEQKRRQGLGQLALQSGQLTSETALNAGNLGMQGIQTGVAGMAQAGTLYGQLGEAEGNLGMQYGQMGQLQQGLQHEDARFTGIMGSLQQENLQKQLDAAYNSQLQRAYEPYQRASWLSDIYAKTPSSQSTLSVASSPSGSGVSTALGTGIQALAAYQGYNQLFNKGP